MSDTKFSQLPTIDGSAYDATKNYTLMLLSGAVVLVPAGGVNDQTGTAYTLALGDIGKNVRCANAAAVVLTVPANASVPIPIGSIIPFSAWGAGMVTATAAAGVTLRTPFGAATTAQYDTRALEKVGIDEWKVH